MKGFAIFETLYSGGPVYLLPKYSILRKSCIMRLDWPFVFSVPHGIMLKLYVK